MNAKQYLNSVRLADRQEIRYSLAYDCPACGKKFTGTGIADYCYHCGQALDWSDSEDKTNT